MLAKSTMEVVANNHFIWNGKKWMGGLRKGKLIAGGFWVYWRIKISQKNSGLPTVRRRMKFRINLTKLRRIEGSGNLGFRGTGVG